MHCLPPQFDVQVRVQRSFSFEELQSGSYFASLDESDLQFYRVYGQPLLIPSPDDVDANFVVYGTYPPVDHNGLHLDPPVLSTKSYTLQDPLGDAAAAARGHTAHQSSTAIHDWRLVKQEPIQSPTIYPNPASSAIASQLYTLPDDVDDPTCVASPSESALQYTEEKPMILTYDEPPMDSLPFPPPASAPSPSYFHKSASSAQDRVLGSPFVHDTSFQANDRRDDWEETSSTPFAPQQYPLSSVARSRRRHSRSPSHSPNRLSSSPHAKPSLDKKPALACLFCRGRKIACGPPQPDSKDKTCNQCARRHLKCEYPLESRRGMRKRQPLVQRVSTIAPDGNLAKGSRKRSADKSS